MPITEREPVLFPEQLFEELSSQLESGRLWRVLHTKPRQEKCLARCLFESQIPFFLPLIRKRLLIRGKSLTSYIPLFPSYLFMLADNAERISALVTKRVVRVLEVADPEALQHDLCQLHRLIESGMVLRPEDRLEPGATVEIRSGPLQGLQGIIVSRASKKRFVVKVDFIHKGASVELDDFTLSAVAP
jgi:transcriptional antiterminator RfaH